jgi:RNA polymerase sigma-70 factor (ECF subfamily)
MTIRDSNKKNAEASQSAVSSAFMENSNLLKIFLRRFLSVQQDIEDVVQEAFLRAYQSEKKKNIEQPKAFLFRIAKNLALTKLTRKSRQITDYIEESDPSVVIQSELTVENEVQALQTLGIYCEAIATLPEKCRHVYLMRKVHGLSHKEIAERLDLTVSSTEKYLHKGVMHCRAYLRERQQDHPVSRPTGTDHVWNRDAEK